MANASDEVMVGNAEALMNDGYRVMVGRVGVEKLIEVDRIFIAQDTGVVVLIETGAPPMQHIVFAPGQLAVVQGIDQGDLRHRA